MAGPSSQRESSLPPPGRYALSGDLVAEARVIQDLARVATGIDSEIGDALRALVLVGPFARGEGGVVELDGEPHAADPGYELLALFTSRPERRQNSLTTMAATWTRLLNARVAIRAIAVRDLAHPPATRFWFHAGRRQLVTLVGDPTLVGAIPRYDASELRTDEPAHALCEGLVPLACATLDPRTGESTLVDRMHRAVLACGDAMLLRRGQYADSLRARAESVEGVCAGAAFRAGYLDAIEFCARPDLWMPRGGGDVQSWLASTRRWLLAWYLDSEAERIGTARDLISYVRYFAPLCSSHGSSERSRMRKFLQALPVRRDEFAGWLLPIERLLRASVALAFATYLPAARLQSARLLRLPGAGRGAIADSALLHGLSDLAHTTLVDGHSRPFLSFDPCVTTG
jgi:hypothetical protein